MGNLSPRPRSCLIPDDNRIAIARREATAWKARPWADRLGLLRQLRDTLTRSRDSWAERLSQATGCTQTDALTCEIFPLLDLLRYYEQNARSILSSRTTGASFTYPKTRSWVHHRPYGVVLVIGPSNFPLQLTLIPAITAVLAGNAVIVKMSDHQPRASALCRELLQQAKFPADLVQWIDGGAEAARALIQAGPDKLFFTGSAAAGRDVLRQAAEGGIPADVELGGSDPFIVLEDAPLDRAARGAVYGAFCNAGQVCVSARRLLVHRSRVDSFTDKVLSLAKELRVGTGLDAELPPLIVPAQAERLKSLVDDAVAKGAKLLSPWRLENGTLYPLILRHVPSEARLWTEDIFGPVMMIREFDTDEEAIRLANESPYGLNASVWSRDLDRARSLMERLETGNGAINDVLKNIGRPDLPFGGVKRSGFGRIHGPEGLLAFTRTCSIVENSSFAASEVNWFPYSQAHARHLSRFMGFLFEDSPLWSRIWRYLDTLRYFREKMK